MGHLHSYAIPIISVFILQTVHFLEFQGATSSSTFERGSGSSCAGYCTSDIQKCKDGGGRIMGFCTNLLACCDPLILSMTKCGDKKTGHRIIDFKSPNYPFSSSGDLYCHVEIGILKDTIATRVDFIQAEMEGPAFSGSEDEPGNCESDMIFLRGFHSWAPPPRCGNLSGYSFLIDRNTPQTKSMQSLTITALMASPSYRWHIRVIQLVKEKSSFFQNSVYYSDTPIFTKGKRSLLNPFLRKESRDEELLTVDESNSYNGNVNDSDRLNSASVINGEDTLISNVPWQVSLRYKLEALITPNGSYAYEVTQQLNANCSISEGIHFCGGSIIGDKFILTASHCFYGTSKTTGMIHLSTVKAVVGDTNLCSDTSSENQLQSFDYDIESVTFHYAYDSQLLINDVAVVKLKTPITFRAHVKPVLLAKTGEDFSEQEGLLSGWGDYSPLKPKIEDESLENLSNTSPSSSATTSTSTTEMVKEIETSTTTATTTTTTEENETSTASSTTTSTSTAATIATTKVPSDSTPSSLPLSSPRLDDNTDIVTSTTTPIPDHISETTRSSTTEFTDIKFPPTPSTMQTPGTPKNPEDEKEDTPQTARLELAAPQILQSSRRFIIQNKSVCNAKDIEEYSATKEFVQKHMKYFSVFDSTLCTQSKEDELEPVSTGKGDSGGPLVVYKSMGFASEKVPILVGVVSYGIVENDGESCKVTLEQQGMMNNRIFDYFASVAFYRKWIDLVTLSHQRDPVGLRIK